MRIRQAFVLAGGKGERLLPLTADIPKSLVKINGIPITQYAVELLAGQGIQQIILGTGHMHEKIEDFFGNGKKFGAEILYSVEKTPLGTGGALLQAEPLLEKRFFMLNGDNIWDADLQAIASQHAETKALGTIALAEVKDVTGFGVAKLNGLKIEEFVEKPSPETAPSQWANAGIYVLEKKNLSLLPEGFCLIEKTMFPELARQKKLFGFLHRGLWLTTDTFERLRTAEEKLKARKAMR